MAGDSRDRTRPACPQHLAHRGARRPGAAHARLGKGATRGLAGRRAPAAAPLAAAPAALALALAGLRDGRRALLTRDLVAAVASDALRVRRYGGERDAKLRGGELLPRPVDHSDDDRFLDHVHPLRRRAAGRATRAAHAGWDMEGVTELGKLALHLLVRLELVDQAALEPAANAGQLRLIQGQVLVFGHPDRD